MYMLCYQSSKWPWKLTNSQKSGDSCHARDILHNLSQWLDFQFQYLKHLSPSYIKDSQELINKLTNLGQLVLNMKLFTTDAVSMYTNIDTEHAIATIRAWLHNQHSNKKLSPDFPLNAIIKATALVMCNNLCEYGHIYKQPIIGNTMGTPTIITWAKIYYNTHECEKLLPKWQLTPLLFWTCFIDNAFSLWLQSTNHNHV